MWTVIDSNDGERIECDNGADALETSVMLNGICNETVRGAIVTALHWIEESH